MENLVEYESSAMEGSLDEESSVLQSLNEDSDENKLEITRNPFDSNLYEKDNFPSLDASVFMESRTPDSRSPAEFRWSIDQIAKLRPADLDMCPNQEYSVTYERKEDEEREQQKVDEYFKNVLLPSPWLDNRTDMLKRVTFSPHPPSTRYIPDSDTDDVMMNSCNSSTNNYHSERTDNGKDVCRKSTLNQKSPSEGVSTGVDASCQTMLTFPTDFNLFDVLGKEFFSYVDESCSSKEIAVSSLRRKLFGQDSANNTPTKRPDGGNLVGSGAMIDNKVQNTPSYTTSSPSKNENSNKTPSLTKSPVIGVEESPPLSPLSLDLENRIPGIIITPDSECSPPKQASNVGSPVGKRLDISFSSVDVSPIRSCEKRNHRSLEDDADLGDDESNYSFLPDVSVDINATEESVFESSRAVVNFESPDISPIKVDQRDDSTQFNAGADSLELRDASSSLQLQSIKESTARNIHAFSGLEELSSITESESKQITDEVPEDKGPLDITELELRERDDNSNGCNFDGSDQTGSDPVDCDISPDLLDITDLDTTKEHHIDESSNHNIVVNCDNNCESVETPTFPGSRTHAHSAKAGGSGSGAEEFVTTPLKGILKRRELPASGPGSGSGSGSSNISSNYEQDTKYNTERNSGRARNRILQSLDVENKSIAENGILNCLSPMVTHGNKKMRTAELLSKSEEKVGSWSWRRCQITEATFSDELVYRRALSALKRSKKLTGSFEREYFDKENASPWKNRLKYQLNSTEVASSSGNSSLKENKSITAASSIMGESNGFFEQRSDSGVASMDWASEPNLSKPSSTVTTPQTPRWTRRSISPLTKFNQLSLHSGHTPTWSQNTKTLPGNRIMTHSANRSNSFLNRSNSGLLDRSVSQRYMISKSYSWPHLKGRANASPYLSPAPRSRVIPKNQSKHTSRKNDEYNSLFNSTDLTSFKDFLPSPLK